MNTHRRVRTGPAPRRHGSLVGHVWQTVGNTLRIERESYLVAAFFLLHLWVNTNRYYLVMLAALVVGLLLISKNVTKSLWIALLCTMPFQQGKYLIASVQSNTYPEAVTPVIYYMTFADALLLMLTYSIVRDRKTYTHTASAIELCVLGLLVCAGISTYFSRFFSVALFGYWQMLRLMLLFLITRTLARTHGWTKLSLEIMTLFALGNAMLILLEQANGGPIGVAAERLNFWSVRGRFAMEADSLYRPGGISDDPNASATVLGMLLPFLVISALARSMVSSALSWTGLVLVAGALAATGSRAAILIATGVSIVSIVIVRRLAEVSVPHILRKYGVVLGTAAVLLAGSFVALRLSSLGKAFSEYGSGTYRMRHLEIGLHTLLRQPLGTGLNTTALEVANAFEPSYYMFDPSELHNIFAQAAAGMGWPGLSLILLLFGLALVRLAKAIKERHNTILRFSLLTALTSFLLTANFYPWLLDMSVSGFFWVMLAFAL